MNKKYILVVKTGEAEIRTVENTNMETLGKVFPVIELTRGRKKTIDENTEIYPFTNRLNRLKAGLKDLDVAIDATSDGALTSPEIDELYEYGNGYEKWVDLVCGIKEYRKHARNREDVAHRNPIDLGRQSHLAVSVVSDCDA